MHEHDGLAVWVAALLVIDLMVVVNSKVAVVERFDTRVERVEIVADRTEAVGVNDGHGRIVAAALRSLEEFSGWG